MNGSLQIYVPGPGDPPDRTAPDADPPELYVPGPAPSDAGLAGRLRSALDAADGDPGELAVRVMQDPGLRDLVLERMERMLRDGRAGAVAGREPGGWLLGAPLADRVGLPFVALRREAGRSQGPATPAPSGELPAMVVAGALEEGGAAAVDRALDDAGLELAGIAALCGDEADQEAWSSYTDNLLFLLDI